MQRQFNHRLSLFSAFSSRKYLNAAERQRFVIAAQRAPDKVRLFCLTLRWSGGRISEILALTPAAIDFESGVVSIATLKRRTRDLVRQVPFPPAVLAELDRTFRLRRAQCDPKLSTARLWCWSRTTAWRRVKSVMAEAGILGTPAMPKGLRHGFGVSAFQSNVPPHIVQRWLGHASLRTTGIYGDVVGPDEQAFAARMWVADDAASHGPAISTAPIACQVKTVQEVTEDGPQRSSGPRTP